MVDAGTPIKVLSVIMLIAFIVPVFFFGLELFDVFSTSDSSPVNTLGKCETGTNVDCQNYQGDITTTILIVGVLAIPVILIGLFIIMLV